MADYGALLDRGRTVASEHPLLAAVPLVTSLLAVGKIERVVGFRGVHFGLRFPTPAPILDLWTFVSVPQSGVNVASAVPLVLLPAFVLVRAVLAAGYLGCIHDALVGAPLSFAGNVRRYVLPMVGFEVLVFGPVLALVPLADLSPAILLVGFPLILLLSYLFYGAPYLVVSADEGLLDALGHSVRLATDGGAYAGFFLALLVGGAVVSVVATAVVVNLGVVGVVLGALFAAPLAVAVNAAAMALFHDLGGGPATRSPGPRGGHRAEGR